MFAHLPPKLADFSPSVDRDKYVKTELLIVEGDSASTSVEVARDRSYQAVLPIQGKPLNAWRATRKKVAENFFYQAIIASIGAGWDTEFELSKSRYDRIVLVFDPDADGIHCSMLVLMFFYRWMRPLLDADRIELVRAPMFQITYDGLTELICIEEELAARTEVSRHIADGKTNVQKKRFRGLGSMGQAVLSQTCVKPSSRSSVIMRAADAEAAIAVFSPAKRKV